MNKRTFLLSILSLLLYFSTDAQNITIEAENYYKQSKDEVRKWYIFNARDTLTLQDLDANHAATASGGAYVEILPDTRVTHDDKLVHGESFEGKAGAMSILHYKVNFPQSGRYYVWARAFSTGSEDNGIHVGLDGDWPASGARMQWCQGKHKWTWESKQRTKEVHCGEPYLIYLDVESTGQHEVTFSMREDGFEFDAFLLTLDKYFVPKQ